MHIAAITLALSNGRRAEPVSYRSQMKQIAPKMLTILLLVLVGTAISASGEKVNLLDVQDQDGNDVNSVASPFGLWAVMNCLAMGAAKNTLAQIQNAFELPATSEGIAEKYKGLSLSLRECPDCANITSHNYILHDNKLKVKDSYAAVMAQDFDATVKGLDFSSPNVADEANEEVKKKQNLTSTPFAKTDFDGQLLVLANAVTFQGAWWSTFESASTSQKPFHDTNGKAIGNVNMMYQQQYFRLSNIDVLNAVALEMPYGYGDKYSMVIVLPNPGGNVKEVSTNLAKTSLKTILSSLKQAPRTEVLTEVPRFKIVSSANLNDKLKNAGVTDMFSPGADFSNIGGGLVVSKVTQDALIEVTEAGTKAEAVTKDYVAGSSGMPEPPPRVFRADRPFVFLIVNKIKETVIFEGQYVSPSLI